MSFVSLHELCRQQPGAHATVAQLAEQRICNPQAEGSSPSGGSNINMKGETNMENLFWIAFTALCALGLVITIPFLMVELGKECRK